MNEATALDVVVIGAGPAGLSASYYLNQLGLSHRVLERGRIGESWRSQRWDSFRMNTANRLNALPGTPATGPQAEEFCSATDYVAALEAYVAAHRLPVREGAEILRVEKPEGEPFFRVTVAENEGIRAYAARQVIVASGEMNERRVPAFADQLSPAIAQLHAADYRHPAQLPAGAVLVAGSGQSGCQIAEDLLNAGRRVYLSTSRVPRLPRRYRGRDILDWLLQINFFEARTEDVTDPHERRMRTPLLSGIGPQGHTLSLQWLARKGATLLGTMENIAGDTAFFQPNAGMHVRFADEFSDRVKGLLDGFIAGTGLPAPLPDVDEADLPNTHDITEIPSLHLPEWGITSVVWTTGFRGQFGYLKLPVLDDAGNPVHQNGRSDVAGLYFLGLHWLRNRKSGLLAGISEDAEFIAGQVCDYARAHPLQLQTV